MSDANLERAYALFRRAAHELEALGANVSPQELAVRLRAGAEMVLDALEGKTDPDDEGSDAFHRLDRQAQDIADDLRRVERLMRGDQKPDI